MKKLIIILMAIFLLVPSMCLSEELPPSGIGVSANKKNAPIHWKYCEDYGQLLKKAFEEKSKNTYRRRGWGASYDFLITRDGNITAMKLDIYQNEYFNKVVKDVILSVKPNPFYEGMNEDSLLFSIYLGYQSYNKIEIVNGLSTSYWGDRDVFMIDIDLKK